MLIWNMNIFIWKIEKIHWVTVLFLFEKKKRFWPRTSGQVWFLSWFQSEIWMKQSTLTPAKNVFCWSEVCIWISCSFTRWGCLQEFDLKCQLKNNANHKILTFFSQCQAILLGCTITPQIIKFKDFLFDPIWSKMKKYISILQ